MYKNFIFRVLSTVLVFVMLSPLFTAITSYGQGQSYPNNLMAQKYNHGAFIVEL